VALVGTLGFRGLALGTSLAALVHGALLLVMTRRALGGLDGRRLAATLIKSAAASSAMAAAALAAHAWLTRTIQNQNTPSQAVTLALAIGAGLVVLAVTARILRIAEFDEAVASAHAQARKLLSR
jgi:putative peptidoglycan lipid II flippase